MVWEDGLELRPDIPAKAFRFDGGEHDRNVEYSGAFRECHDVVNDSLTVKVAGSEQHLWLMVDQRHNAILRSQQPLFAEFWTYLAWAHSIPPLKSLNLRNFLFSTSARTLTCWVPSRAHILVDAYLVLTFVNG